MSGFKKKNVAHKGLLFKTAVVDFVGESVIIFFSTTLLRDDVVEDMVKLWSEVTAAVMRGQWQGS